MASGNPEHNQDATPLTRLSQLTDEDRAALAAKNITTLDGFLAEQTQDPKLMHHLGLPDWRAMERVAEAISFAVDQRWKVRPRASEALATATGLTRRRLRTRIPDLLLAVVLLLVSVGMYKGCSTRTAVVAPHGLTPFELIAPSDISISGRGRNSVAASNEMFGKYSMIPVPPGGEINLATLSPRSLPANALKGRRILRLVVQASPLEEGLRPQLPVKISLMLAPKDKEEKGMLLDNIYLLDIQTHPGGISAVLAISETDAQTLASLEAKSDLIIVASTR